MNRAVLAAAVLLLVVISALGGGLVWTHWTLRRERPPLPEMGDLMSPGAETDLPVSLTYINTASQRMPRQAVLHAATDPFPEAPYVMSHPAFVLRWADGRLLLVDAGMTPEAAREFGRPLEWLARAEPLVAHGSAAEQLGRERERVAGVVFTHLHTDHVEGIDEICRGRAGPLTVWMTPSQATQSNYTTRPGRQRIDAAGCARVATLGGERIVAIPGFPGVTMFAAGGHTPGTQVILAWVQGPSQPRLHVLAGDVANQIDGINHNLSKPLLYRLLVVPEDDFRLGELRILLRRLRDEHGATVLVAHDQLAIEASGVAPFQRHN